jgi:hypothetical protein
MLKQAEDIGCIGIYRPPLLCGDMPNIPVYQHAVGKMGNVDGIVAVHACSPNLNEKLIATTRGLMEFGYKEVMTCHPIVRAKDYHAQHWNIYGSIWGIERERLMRYEDPYKPNPEVLLVDDSIDIHYEEDYELALKLAQCQ